MKRINIDRGWSMAKEAPAMFFPMQGRMGKEGAREVNLPHDCNLDEPVARDCPDGAQVAYFKGNMAVYTRNMEIPGQWEGQSVYLELDGAYCNTEIVVNGHQAAMHPNGYAPFVCEITDCLKYGQNNRIAVFVNNSMMRTARWYSGTGIYRHVDLRVGPMLHLSANPLFLYTEKTGSGYAQVNARVEVENKTGCDRKVRARVNLYEDMGRGVPHAQKASAGAECVIFVPAGEKAAGCCSLFVEEPKLWSPDSPALYVAEAELVGEEGEQETVLDKDSTLFGIRTITADARNGLLINGRSVKIKGGCMHHDNGILGAASFYDSEYRRLKKHKDNGFNGIRGAHNPMSRDMLEACDRLGLLMYAEAFDVWNMHKNVNDYHQHFDAWWERDLQAFIERDRNHPCIFCWSVGNEITERNGLKGGAKYSAMLAAKVRSLDSTRPVSSAIPTLFNGMDDEDTMKQLQAMMNEGGPGQNLKTGFAEEIWADRTEGFCAPLDIVGYNYLTARYESDHERYPDRVICGTESYPPRIDEVWEKVERLPYVIGDFTWTSQDYLGEATCGNIVYREPSEPPVSRGQLQGGDHFPARTANCSDFDICGHDMPALHYRRVVWGSDETYIAVMNPGNYGKTAYRTDWAWDDCRNQWHWPGFEGRPVSVEVYSAAEEVELFVNGVSAGRAGAGRQNRFKACFDTVYQAGSVEAVSYSGGQEVSRQKLVTPGRAVRLAVTAERTSIPADGQSLAYCEVEVVDENGLRVPDAAVKITASVAGAASLAAFGSSIPSTQELYTAGEFTSYEGRLQAILRSGYEPGEAVLTVRSEEFGDGCVRIDVREALDRSVS